MSRYVVEVVAIWWQISVEAMLTERIVRDATPGPKTRVLWDGQVKGLGCRVHVSGRKTYVLSYRVRGRKVFPTLGRCSDWSLRNVREFAREELARAARGDPGLTERRRRVREAPTLNDALQRFFEETVPERIAAGRLTKRTAGEYLRQARGYVAPALGSISVSEVTRHDVERFASALRDRPMQRNRVLAFLSRIFSLTEHWEWRRQHSNPVRGVERGVETPRRRILSSDELVALSGALDAARSRWPASVAAIRVAALTGLRISEVLAMRWADADSDSGRVVLPHTKTGARVHDLPAAALSLINGLPRINEWIFTTGRRAPVMYRTVRYHFSQIVADAGVENVRLHDLRRTLITNAAASGESVFVIRDLLGHSTVTMAARYVQEAGLDVRGARERAGRTMGAILDGHRREEGAPETDG